jgi:hypothetical protein
MVLTSIVGAGVMRLVAAGEFAGVEADAIHLDRVGAELAIEDIAEGDHLAAVGHVVGRLAGRPRVRQVFGDHADAGALGAHAGGGDFQAGGQVHLADSLN